MTFMQIREGAIISIPAAGSRPPQFHVFDGESIDAIDAALAAGETVYVHCYGGIGRTGTVIGCWLVRRGLNGEEALSYIAARRAGTPDGRRASPETSAQRALVLNWSEGSNS